LRGGTLIRSLLHVGEMRRAKDRIGNGNASSARHPHEHLARHDPKSGLCVVVVRCCGSLILRLPVSSGSTSSRGPNFRSIAFMTRTCSSSTRRSSPIPSASGGVHDVTSRPTLHAALPVPAQRGDKVSGPGTPRISPSPSASILPGPGRTSRFLSPHKPRGRTTPVVPGADRGTRPRVAPPPD